MDENFNYIFKCWHEFTTLTENERSVLNRLYGIESESEGIYMKSWVRCVDPGEVFKTIAAAARAYSIPKQRLWNNLKRKGLYVMDNGFILERI